MLEAIEADRIRNGFQVRSTAADGSSEHRITWDDTVAVHACGRHDVRVAQRRTPRRWTVLRFANAGDGTELRLADGRDWHYGGTPAAHLLPPRQMVDIRLRGFCSLQFIAFSDRLVDDVRYAGRPSERPLRGSLEVENTTVNASLETIATRCRTGPVAAVSWLRAIAPIAAGALLSPDETLRTSKPFDRMQLPDWRLKRLDQLIDSTLHQRITLGSMASSCGLSAFHFARVFRHMMGVSPIQYVLQRRCERARELIEEGRLPLSEIATSCGFAHQAHFTTVFRRMEGVTPGRLRRDGGRPSA